MRKARRQMREEMLVTRSADVDSKCLQPAVGQKIEFRRRLARMCPSPLRPWDDNNGMIVSWS